MDVQLDPALDISVPVMLAAEKSTASPAPRAGLATLPAMVSPVMNTCALETLSTPPPRSGVELRSEGQTWLPTIVSSIRNAWAPESSTPPPPRPFPGTELALIVSSIRYVYPAAAIPPPAFAWLSEKAEPLAT